MPPFTLEYPKQPYSTVNRYNQRANYALETIHSIINSSPFIYVSFNTPGSPFPMMLPMIGMMGSFSRPSAGIGDVLDLYVHGYVSSRLTNNSRNAGSADADEGLPVSISTAHVDGFVLSLTPNSHDYNYRSATLFGHATVVSDVEERLYAMELITNSVVPDRWRHTRVPPNNAEMQSTSILRIKISAGSAKVRTGMPVDVKGDTENEDLVSQVWQGVIPVYTTLGRPIAGPLNKVDAVPEFIDSYVKDFNEQSEAGATEVALKATP
ncbi:flavin-nucleotide-binding protein [Xylariales sp. PMI_506]|nr:flavin-nucleotide-binding protein [Xylariales sp. PMI_506]